MFDMKLKGFFGAGIVTILLTLLAAVGMGALSPMVVRTTPRNRIYSVYFTAPKTPRLSYYQFMIFKVSPKKIILQSRWVPSVSKALDDGEEKSNQVVTRVDLKHSTVVTVDKENFVVPAGVQVKQNIRFLKTPKNQRYMYLFELVGKPSGRLSNQKKDGISVKVHTKVRYIGWMIPAKPKPYPRFNVKKKEGWLYFKNASSRYSAAILECTNGSKKKLTYRLVVPSSRRAPNKRAMSWNLNEFIKIGRSQEHHKNLACQAIYYKRLPSDKRSKWKKMLTL